MSIIKNIKLSKLNKRIECINNIQDSTERINKCSELFIDILKNETLYLVASPKTSEDEWKSGKFMPFIAEGSEENQYYLRVFTDKDLAIACARKIESISKVNTELVSEISALELVSVVNDYFIMGIDGVLLNDGEAFISIKCEKFLEIACNDALNIPDKFNKDFVNTIKAIYDIAKKRVRIVAPAKYFEDITTDDVLSGSGQLYTFSDELLLLDYYDKYKVENIFKEKVYWVDMNIEMFYSIVEVALFRNVKNIKIVYRNIEANGSPDQILELLKSVGFKGYS
jgi:hypothetical protein